MRSWIFAAVVIAGGCEKESAGDGGGGVELGEIGDAAKNDDPPAKDADVKAEGHELAAAEGASPVAAYSAAKQRMACVQAQMLLNSAEMFQMMEGELPPDVASMEAKGVISKVVDDPWGNDYAISGAGPKVTSAGPDQKMGTADDIVVEAGVADPCKGI